MLKNGGQYIEHGQCQTTEILSRKLCTDHHSICCPGGSCYQPGSEGGGARAGGGGVTMELIPSLVS